MQETQKYQKTRIILTLVYLGIIAIILVAFSIAITWRQFVELRRFEELRESPMVAIRLSPQEQYRLAQVQSTAETVRNNTVISIGIIDGIILFWSALASYYLAGRNMRPIINALEKQNRFVADASHELRTPLTIIKTQAEVLLHDKHAKLTDYQEFTTSTVEEVDRLTNLSNKLLSLAKSETTVSQNSKSNLTQLLSKVISRYRVLADNKKIKINLENNSLSEILVRGTDEQLTELIEIILDNAIKYTPNKGEIKIEVKVNETVQLKISDTGIGIEPDNISKVFDRFYRVSDSRNETGFGLGLSIAKQICDNIGAEIKLSSAIGKGTTVEIDFIKSNN